MDNNPYVQYAIQAAQRAGIDPSIFVRQINQESGFNPAAQSGAGAQGIAQIVPKWHPGVDTSDPYASLDYAARLMKSHLDQFGGRYDLALAAYNAGAGAVQQYGGVPPFDETQNYVSTILGSGAGGGGGGGAPANTPAWANGGHINISSLPATDTGGTRAPYADNRSLLTRAVGNLLPGNDWSNAIGSWLNTSGFLRASPDSVGGWGPNGYGPRQAQPSWVDARNRVVGEWGPNAGQTGATATTPSTSTSGVAPEDDPNDYRYWLNRLKDAPFRNQQEFEQWWQMNKDDAQLSNEYKRAQIAQMQRQAGQQSSDNAFRQAQLSQNAFDTMVKMRSGPQDWVKYWYTSRGQTVPAGQESVPITQALPPWAQFGGGPPQNPPVTPPVVQPTGPAWGHQSPDTLDLLAQQRAATAAAAAAVAQPVVQQPRWSQPS